MSTRNLHTSKGRSARKADSLTAICDPIVWKMWEPRRITIIWASMACYWDRFTLFYYIFTDICLERLKKTTKYIRMDGVEDEIRARDLLNTVQGRYHLNKLGR
jgi:hypothetical protein